MVRKLHRTKSHKRRHTRKHTHKYTRKSYGGSQCGRVLQAGGRGGMGGAELGHAYTTGASQTLYQLTGRTPGLSSGGKRAPKKPTLVGYESNNNMALVSVGPFDVPNNNNNVSTVHSLISNNTISIPEIGSINNNNDRNNNNNNNNNNGKSTTSRSTRRSKKDNNNNAPSYIGSEYNVYEPENNNWNNYPENNYHENNYHENNNRRLPWNYKMAGK